LAEAKDITVPAPQSVSRATTAMVDAVAKEPASWAEVAPRSVERAAPLHNALAWSSLLFVT
jgi:hypothetical protein